MNTDEKMPLCADIERLILGSVMIGAAVMDAMRTTIEVDDFGLEKHRRIWRACCAVYDSGRRPDRVMIYEHLRSLSQEESIGGITYLCGLDEGLPQFPSLDGYVARLKDTAMLRRIILIAGKAESECMSGSMPAEEVRNSLSKALSDLSQFQPGEDRPISTKDLIDRLGIDALLRPRREEGLRFPWKAIERVIPGMHSGQMIVIAAYTGKGKTSAALQAAAHAARQGKAVLYWSLEMQPDSLFRRLVSQATGGLQIKPSYEDRTREREAAAWLYENPIWFDVRSRSVPSFAANVRRLTAQHRIGLAVVDYLGLIRAVGRVDSRTREVGENSRSLKLAAVELGIPLIVLSQFRRPDSEGKAATIHDLKESGDIENDADVVILINSPRSEGSAVIDCQWGIGKQREGPAGFDIPMQFHPASQTFHSVEDR